MTNNLDKIIDECIDRINRGESVAACLTDYPEYSEELGPLLSAILETKTAYSFIPSARAKNFHRQRFTAALVVSRERREKRQPFFPLISGWSKVWATAAAVIVIVLLGYFGLRPALMPPVMIAQSNLEGNFVFLVSDEVNAISDFEKLSLSISKVSLHLGGDEERKIEFTPEVQMVDLTDLQGNRAQEIWRGDVPEGEYIKVFLEISQVTGILWDSGEEVDIKLPSSKLQISKPFRVESGELTNFVYDLTVIKAGKSGQYILKPQIDQSGADQDFVKVEPEGQPEDNGESKGKPQKPGKPGDAEGPEGGKLTLEILGKDIKDMGPGDSVTLHVSFGDKDVEGAKIWVNDEEQDVNTGEYGTIVIYIPEDADALSVKAVWGEFNGGLQIKFKRE